MNSPAPFPPTKEMALISGCSVIYLVVSNPPFTMFNTPLGNPISFKISANLITVLGTLSEGFNTKVFPKVMA